MKIKTNRRGTRYRVNYEGRAVSKECVTCKRIKEIKHFCKRSNGFLGVQPSCRDCCKDKYERYKRNNLNKVRELNKISARKYRNKNRVKIKRSAAEYYQENREEVLGRVKRYFKDNPHKRIENTNKRRAIKRSLKYEMVNLKNKCYLTNRENNTQVDHVIPLSTGRGGHHAGNVIRLAAELNQSKSDSNIFEWFADNRERFDLSQRKFDKLIEYLADINEMTVEEYRDYVYWCHNNPRTVDEIMEERASV